MIKRIILFLLPVILFAVTKPAIYLDDNGWQGEFDDGDIMTAPELRVSSHASVTGNFQVNTNDFFVNTTTGNVGIGTKNPGVKLSVDGGNIFVDGANSSAAAITIRGRRDSTPTTLFETRSYKNGFSAIGNNTLIYRHNTDAFDGTSLYTTAREDIYMDGTVGTGVMPGMVVWSTNTGSSGVTAPTERLWLNKDGNVGIGIYPQHKLHLSGSGLVTGNLTISGDTSVTRLIFSDMTSMTTASVGGGGGDATTLDGIDSTQFLRSDTVDESTGLISFSAGISTSSLAHSGMSSGSVLFMGLSNIVTQSNANLFFDGSNLGVGTAAPTTKLYVKDGDITINDTANSAGQLTIIGERDNDPKTLLSTQAYRNGGAAVANTDIVYRHNVHAYDGNSLELIARQDLYMESTVGDEIMPSEWRWSTRRSSGTDPEERLWLDSEGRLGVGINPTFSLHVSGDSYFANNMTVSGNTSITKLIFSDGTSMTTGALTSNWTVSGTELYPTIIGNYGSTGAVFTGSGGLKLDDFLTADKGMLMATSGAVSSQTTTGNINIRSGNNTVVYTGTGGSTSALYVYKGTTTIGHIFYGSGKTVHNDSSDTTGDFQVKGLTDDNMIFGDASADNVGIGTALPRQKLQVAGSISATGLISSDAISGVTLSASTLTSGSILFSSQNGLINQSNSKLFWNGSNVGIGTSSTTAPLTVSGGVSVTGNLSLTGPDVYLGTNVSTNISITGFPGLSDGNDFGIKAGRAGSLLGSSWQGGDLMLMSGDANGGSGNANGGDILLSSGKATGSGEAGDILFKINNIEKMRVDSSGNIGVGTSTPSKTFDVNGTSAFSGISTFSNGISATSLTQSIFSSGPVRFRGSTNDSGITMTSGGSVGIGEINPSSALVVKGAILSYNDDNTGSPQINLESYRSSSPRGQIRFQSSGGTSGTPSVLSASSLNGRIRQETYTGASGTGFSPIAFIDFYNSTSTPTSASAPSRIEFATNDTNEVSPITRMTIDRGNVGIGTTAPSVSLQVSGNVSSSGYLQVLQVSNLITAGLTVLDNTSARSLRLWADTSVAHIDAGNTGQRDILFNGTGTGNIGISTTNTTSKLNVSGAISGSSTANFGGVLTSVGLSNSTATTLTGSFTISPTTSITSNPPNIKSTTIIMRSPDGTCSSCGPSNTDTWSCASITCPP